MPVNACPGLGGPGHVGGNPYNGEIVFRVTSPAGTTVNLVNAGTYTSSSTYGGRVQVTFDDAAAAVVGGLVPVSGTFCPVSPLAGFNGQNPKGTWTLFMEDTVGADPLCFNAFRLEITTDATFASWDPGDDRINPQPAAPVALYCQDGVVGLDRLGSPVLFASQAQIAAVGNTPAQNTLIVASADGVARLYRLTSGWFQVNVNMGAQEYEFQWDACPPGHTITRVFDTTTFQTLVYHEDIP